MAIADVRHLVLADELIRRIRSLRLFVFDFDGVFTDNSIYLMEDGRESVRCNRSDGIGLEHLRELGLQLLILSTETNPVVSVRSRKLKVPCIQGCGDKGNALKNLLGERSLSWHEVGFLGNDVNDRPVLEQVGFPAVVMDAHPEVLHLAAYRTSTPGGHGAVREVCDLVVRVKAEH